MAHSRIIQLENVKPENFADVDIDVLTENLLTETSFPNSSWVDYWGDSTDLEEDFDWFVSCLPKGMFDVNKQEKSITYKAEPTEYLEEWVDNIKAEVNELNAQMLIEDGWCTWKLKRLLNDNLNNLMIYTSEDGFPVYMHDWLLNVARQSIIGDTFYMGGSVDYHF